jgi:hypothetical protein
MYREISDMHNAKIAFKIAKILYSESSKKKASMEVLINLGITYIDLS